MHSLIYLWLGISMVLSSATAPAARGPIMTIAESPEAKAWADSVYQSMSEQQRIAQLFVPRLDISDNAAGRRQLQQVVQAGVGGILLGKGTVAGYRALISAAQAEARVPLLITLDGEWGLAMRVTDTPRFPYNIALGAISDPELMRQYGREVARECRAMGIHVDFAPVLDVNSNPNNPVIGFRSLGENPQRVADLGTAFSRGLEEGGVMAVAKHFPGHGDTSTDSHKTLPVVDHDMARLTDVDLRPFRQFIGSGLSGVMVGHLNVPALDASGTPASMSAKVVTDMLRGSMAFGGLIWTDALAMKGADSSENNCVRALRAGADVLLGSSAPLADIEAVSRAVASGKISREAVREHCLRLLRYKYALIIATEAAADQQQLETEATDAVMRRLAEASVVCVKNSDGLLPLRDLRHRSVAVVSLGAGASNAFAEGCMRYAPCVNIAAADGHLTAAQQAKAEKADVVVIALMSTKDGALAGLRALAGKRPTVLVSFVNPYRLAKVSDAVGRCKAVLSCGDDTKMLRDYGSQAVFGGIEVTGRMPVAVKGVCSEGQGCDLSKTRLGYSSPAASGASPGLARSIDSIVNAAISAHAIPGCQVVVASHGDVIINSAYGRTSRSDVGTDVTPSTLYDIASVTKAAATTSGVMKAVDLGLMDIDAPLGRYLTPAKDKAVGQIPLRKLLTHHSGMPAILNVAKLMADTASYSGPLTSGRNRTPYTLEIEPGIYANTDVRLRSDLVAHRQSADFDLPIASDLYVGTAAPDTIMARICDITPGADRYKYSDLNFCLLAAALEETTGVTLDQWVDTEIYGPLGMGRTTFRAADTFPLAEIAPTENDRWLRKSLMHGYVHDELASFSGGVQGNAGLFANASDLATLGQMWLNGGTYGGERILSEATVSAFTSPRAATSDGRRLPGFDRLGPDKVSGLSTSTFGHTGFTGTCIWIDPERELVYVFLSNRVNPSRVNPAWSKHDPRRPLLRALLTHL